MCGKGTMVDDALTSFDDFLRDPAAVSEEGLQNLEDTIEELTGAKDQRKAQELQTQAAEVELEQARLSNQRERDMMQRKRRELARQAAIQGASAANFSAQVGLSNSSIEAQALSQPVTQFARESEFLDYELNFLNTQESLNEEYVRLLADAGIYQGRANLQQQRFGIATNFASSVFIGS